MSTFQDGEEFIMGSWMGTKWELKFILVVYLVNFKFHFPQEGEKIIRNALRTLVRSVYLFFNFTDIYVIKIPPFFPFQGQFCPQILSQNDPFFRDFGNDPAVTISG